MMQFSLEVLNEMIIELGQAIKCPLAQGPL